MLHVAFFCAFVGGKCGGVYQHISEHEAGA